MTKPLPNQWWTTRDIEERIGVFNGSCARWIRKGLIKAIKTSKGGHYRISPEEAERFLRERGVLAD